MSYFTFVVYLLLTKAVLVVLSLPTDGPQTLTCANVLCNVGNGCRHVAACSTCTIEPKCIPEVNVRDDINFACRRLNYTEAILTEVPGNRYNLLTCYADQRCPLGSDCVGGLCCKGRVSIPITKPGICPKILSITCGNDTCTNDYYCPGKKKCCNLCGNVCVDPIFVEANQCADLRCATGEVCVMRTPYCPPGMMCLQALLPMCVPRQCAKCIPQQYCKKTTYGYGCSRISPCGKCPAGQMCVPDKKQCFTTPCPQFKCVPIDSCSGCPVGEVCRPNTCSTYPCSRYKCYPATTQ